MDTRDLIQTLSALAGPPGREEAVRSVIADLWRPLVDDLRVDGMGNLIALRRGRGPEGSPRRSLMAAAHMDEIGLIVTGIDGTFLRIAALGGIDRRVLLGLEVRVHGRRELPGVIGSRPPHVLPASERKNMPPWHELFIDTGLPAEELEEAVRVGDHVTVQQSPVVLMNDRIAGKALDNRASVAALTLALDLLQRRTHTWDFVAVATVQEEVGIKGAITSAYGVAPDLAIALDVTFAKQHNDSDTGVLDMDKGPAIGVGPNCHPQIVARLRDTAKAEEIPALLEPLPGSSGTDAWGIQIAREGIPTGLLSIPVRYMHQPVELVTVPDVERTGRLLASFASGLEPEFCPRWEDEL